MANIRFTEGKFEVINPAWHLVTRADWGDFDSKLTRHQYLHTDASSLKFAKAARDLVMRHVSAGVNQPNIVCILTTDTLREPKLLDAGEYEDVRYRVSEFPKTTLQFMPYTAIAEVAKHIKRPDEQPDVLYRALWNPLSSVSALAYRLAIEGVDYDYVSGAIKGWVEYGVRRVEWRVLQQPLIWSPHLMSPIGADLNTFSLHTTALVDDVELTEEVSFPLLYRIGQLPKIGV